MEGGRNILALQRLIARLPHLNENPTIMALLSKGSNLTSEDVLDMCQELFLRPELTVVIAGCFRHLLSRIVKSIVDALRESYAHRTLTDMSNEPTECSISTSSWNLYIHEYAVIAFSQVLELAPHLLSSILEYFLFAPPPFERLLHGIAFSDQQKWKSQPSLLDVAQASYRLILLEPASFESLWDWSPFLDLLLYEGSEENDVRWCAVQILSLVFKLSDEATRAFGLKISCLTEEKAFSCLLRWEELHNDTAVEKGGWFVEPYTEMEASSFDSKSLQDQEKYIKWNCDLSGQTSHVDVCGIELPVRKNMIRTESWPRSFGKSMLATTTLRGNLKALALALSQQEPILLEGCEGSGKTSLIQELGELTGNTDAVFIHLNEQIDGKMLFGTYVCTEIPGEFRWQPGVITQAVLRGLWLVLEDVDKAPSEVLSALVPLLESRKIYITGRAETVKAAANFQLFATVTRTDAVSTSHSADVLNNLWRKVVVVPPNDSELGSIITVLFPALRPLVPKLIETLKLIDAFASQASLPVDAFSTRIFFGRRFSIRDLLKWCKRLKNIKEIGLKVQPGSIWEIIFREAVDCFAACISDSKSRHLVMNGIAKLWGVGEEQVKFFEVLNKPAMQIISGAVQVGRACLSVDRPQAKMSSGQRFAYTGHSMRNLERIAVCVQQQEPVLLVGETGTGKTTLVQHLADQVAIPLIVMNLSQQSDSADFIGGFKPVEAQQVCIKLLERFKELFCRTFPSQHNSEYLARVHQFAEKRKLKQLLNAFGTAVTKVESLTGRSSMSTAEGGIAAHSQGQPKAKRKRPMTNELLDDWDKFSLELGKCERQILAAENTFAFAFVEGAFVRALRHGYWILLDELNLAPVETLERITGVLEGENGSLNLTERGDIKSIPRHPNFRLFACMNPATDVGKHDLPMSLKNRFTEFYVDETMGADDLQLFVFRYLEGLMPNPPVAPIVDFYQRALQEAEARLYDSANQKPRYSLRSLARALEYTQVAMPLYGFVRALYDGVCMTFLTLLDHPSSAIMENLIQSHLIKNLGFELARKDLLARGPGQPSDNHIEFEHFWLEKGNFNPSISSLEFTQRYVLTKTVKQHLKNVAKAVFIRKYPVLLQGPTSSGKTSSIEYLATITSHRFVRINNHEHTDLQEYLGTYVTSPQGKLVFQEGILVEAVRNGYWVVLDELNLAPSEVLEALNRLLDDNRELFIPELQLVVKPHPHFMLFATQNPPGLYGGRKVLSRAFRNRFLELYVDDIPEDELCIILEQRCEIPRSYAEKMVAVMKDLQRNRQTSQAFAGKHGFITARDLLKWADRHRKSGVSYEDLARIGYTLLAERLRDANEKTIVRACLEKNLRTKINIETLYSELSVQSHIQEVKEHLASKAGAMNFGNIVWTKSMTRLFSLVEQCYQHREPVLLIGETGCGKTTVCQLLSVIYERSLRILNCHQHTETADFLGGFRPVRERESIVAQFEQTLGKINSSKLFCVYHSDKLPHSIKFADNTIKSLCKVIQMAKASGQFDEKGVEMLDLELSLQELERLKSDYQALFVWQDGPLVQAMRRGEFFLVDEISLADDSVLERLNSVLEPKRLLVLAEKGGSNVEELAAHPDFFLMATMNPGGDFGKKELSPALRNRFTEIWVPPITEEDDLRSIIHTRFLDHYRAVLMDPLLNFWKWYQEQHSGRGLTVRDLLSWILFVNSVEEEIGTICAFIHGAFLVLLDGISLGMGLSMESARSFRNRCLDFLLQQLPVDKQLIKEDFHDNTMMRGKFFRFSENKIGINPFFISKGPVEPKEITFELMAPTTSINTFRILRAMQLPKPVLVEGSPGVGKTSLITALANISGHSLVRINLSEQTDMMDLLGSDLPVEGAEGADFRWSDGVFLQALKSGSWVVLDELNLASQSVLEGLNACLDHRGEVFIPELGRSFKCHPTFRIFACQNPSLQGGGRKSLPRSFLNRFTKVYVDTLSEEDFLFIARSLYPSISPDFLQKLIHFNTRILEDTMVSRSYGQLGAPWEFNLRDVLRSCALVEGGKANNVEFLEIVYLQRMRTARDRCCVLKLYEEVFGSSARLEAHPSISLDVKCLQIGKAVLPRSAGPQSWSRMEDLTFLPGQLKCLESLLLCIKHGWMSILVGPSGCGKTSIIRLVAKLTGTPLQEFALSSGTDTTDLLGCYEQYDGLRCWQKLANKVGYLVQFVIGQCLISFDKRLPADKLVSIFRRLLADWLSFEKSLNLRADASHGSYSTDSMEMSVLDLSDINLLSQVVDQLKFVSRIFEEPSPGLRLETEAIENELLGLKRKVSSKVTTNHFEWVDGGFLKAVERGDWVLLENANMCSPTVLDRLNPLLEPNGAILVNERGLTCNTATVLRAHPNFRLFLTVDPCHGEISRAMRNRGVEIHLMQPHRWIDNANGFNKEEEGTNDARDCRQYLIHAGIPSVSLVTAMSDAHIHASRITDSSALDYSACIKGLCRWVSLFWQLFNRGSSLSESLSCSWDQIYVHGYEDFRKGGAMKDVYNTHFTQSIYASMVQSSSTLVCPGGWPRPLNVSHFCRMSVDAMTMRDCMYLEHLLGEQAAYQARSVWSSTDSSERESLFKWMQNQKDVAVVLPCPLFQLLLHPSFSKSLVFVESFAGDLQILDRMIMYASFWIMRGICRRRTREMGFTWMKWQAGKVGSHCNSLKLFCKILQKESGHPLYDQTMATNSNCQVIDDNHLDLLDALRRTLLQWQIEDDSFEESHQNRNESVIIRSFKCYTGHSKDNVMEMEWNNLALEMYPVFLFVRHLEEEVLSCSYSPWSKETCKMYLQLLDSHKALWKTVCEIFIESDVYSENHGLYLCWKKLSGIMIVLISDFSSEKVAAKFMQTVQSIEKVFCAKKRSLKLYLWKHSGHPLIPSTKEAFQELLALLNFCNWLWPDSAHGEGDFTPISSNEVFRRLCLEGIAMALSVLQGLWKDKEDNSVPRGGEIVARDILKKLCDRVNDQKLQKSFPAHFSVFAGCKCLPFHLVQDSCYREALLKGCEQRSNLLVLPWLDSLSLIQDSILVATVTQIASGLPCHGGHDVSPKEFVDAKEQLLGVLDFSLKFSSRSPLDLVPHQQILWLINAISVDGHFSRTFIKEFQSFGHQLRFNWYSAAFRREPKDDLCSTSARWITSKGAGLLFNASNSVQISCVIMQVVPLKQLNSKIMELRLATKVLWDHKNETLQHYMKTDFLHASATFCQLICSFAKSFKRDDADEIHSLLKYLHTSAEKDEGCNREDEIQRLKLLLRKSSDERFISFFDSHVSLCLDWLYGQSGRESSSRGFHSLYGRVWLLLGATRLNLVLPSQAYDPAAKYRFEHSILLEKHSEAKLELQVREENELIVRGGSTSEDHLELQNKIQELEREIETTASKCVYRQEAENLGLLFNEINCFVKSMDGSQSLFAWITALDTDAEKHSLLQVTEEVLQWQEVSMKFIQGVLSKYPDYKDLAQPILLAVFEIKLGLAFLFAAFQLKNMLQRGFDGHPSNLYEFICGVMEFPTSSTFFDTTFRDAATKNAEPVLYFLREDFIESMVATIGLKEQEIINLKVTFFQCAILHVRNKLLHGGLASGKFSEIVHMLLDLVSVFWSVTRDSLDAKRLEGLSSIQIKQQSHNLGLDLDQDEECFRTMFPEASGFAMVDPDELDIRTSDEDVSIDAARTQVSEQVWKGYECKLGKELTDLLNVIFSLQTASKRDGIARTVSDDQRLAVFIPSYDIGRTILEGIGALLPPSLNERLIPAHMLMLSLKQESLSSTQEKPQNFNIYEDSSPSELARLLTSLEVLQERIMKLLAEWPNQPSLVQLMRGLEALLSMPVNVPLVKALTGVEQLLSKAQLWEENAPKSLSLQDVLGPLQHLVSNWRKFELQYWEVLLQKVESQFDQEADKLWFSLYGVLHPISKIDLESDLEPMIASLEEFMQTAALGEYKRRLQMVTGFYGKFCIQNCLSDVPSYVSRLSNVIRNALFNVSRYYTQFVPLIEDSITAARNVVSKELKDFLKLHKWDERNYYALTSSTVNTHRRLFKFVSKYKALLGKPALASVIDSKHLWSSVRVTIGPENEQTVCNEGVKASSEDPNVADCKRYSYETWLSVLQMKAQDLISLPFSYSEDEVVGVYKDLPTLLPRFWGLLNTSIFSEQVIQARQRGAAVLEDVATTVIARSNKLREGEKKRMVKKKALVDLLRSLRSLGFSHHRSAIPKEERSPKSWILQTPCKVDCFLDLFMIVSGNSSIDATIFTSEQFQNVSCLWNKACDYYFRNLALIQQLRQLSLNFHKDLTLQEVAASISYLEHGLFIQQTQRYFADKFAFKLVSLQSIVRELGSFACFNDPENLDWNTVFHKPDFERKWLWVQKGLLDSLYNSSLETSLLYKKASVVQKCPCDPSLSGLGAIINGLEALTASLGSCKKNLDELLVPGVQLFSAEELESSWPVLINPRAMKLIHSSFSTVSSAKKSLEILFRQTDHCSFGLRPLWENCCKASKMLEDYEKECKEESLSIETDSALLREAYKTERNQLITEVLLSVQALTKLSSKIQTDCVSDEPVGHMGGGENIPFGSLKVLSWVSFMEEQMSALRLDKICHTVVALTLLGVRQSGREDVVIQNKLREDFSIIVKILELLVATGLTVFTDYMSLHKSLSKLSYVLSNLFETLLQEGFCKTQVEAEQELASKMEEACGTGMGEGQGNTDVSHEIEDENQLLGSSEKNSQENRPSEDNDFSTEKGIEMGEDFEGELMDISVSESDGSEQDDDGVQLESKMGEVGENENIVDQSLWSKDDEEEVGGDRIEKYETGSSVQETGSDLEFRAKDKDADGTEDQREEKSQKDSKVSNGSEQAEEDFGSTLEKSDAYEAPSGIDPSVDADAEDTKSEVDEADNFEDLPLDNVNESLEAMDVNDDVSEIEEGDVKEQEPSNMPVDGGIDADAEDMVQENIADETSEGKQETYVNKSQEHPSNQVSDSGLPQGATAATDLTNSGSGQQSSFDVLSSLLRTASMEISLLEEIPHEPVDGSNVTSDNLQVGLSGATGQQKQSMGSNSDGKEDNLQNLDRLDANPYRSLGDVLKQWKERVTVKDESIPQTKGTQNSDGELEAEGSEYQYVSEEKDSGQQALGSATFDQMNQKKVNKTDFEPNISNDDMAAPLLDMNTHNEEGNLNEIKEMSIERIRNNSSQKHEADGMDKQLSCEDASLDLAMSEALAEHGEINIDPSYVSTKFNSTANENSATDLLSKTAPYNSEDTHRIRKELENAFNMDSQNIDKARSLWAMYEQLTTRLSQELTEQLRLIMEPSLASRLEGDYRTGKRINLKKVIPYIASKFRRDKIWLRRTKPSKRQYQVVLAIDDSRSMSESHCGHLALEALITICRSMSTLEVGQMAVASFGQKGNVKILHDFDSSFTTEAGIRMISQFSFKQDNTIADEPMVDLLHYLTLMLDVVAKNTSSSGRHQLRQLVLIIADGRFHEKETLRRCIREAVSRGQMLAFIVLDSTRESIMDVQSVSFSGGAPTFSKYIDSFPFPYYILLKNIEELPRTLVDLLRQWFDMVQRTRLQ